MKWLLDWIRKLMGQRSKVDDALPPAETYSPPPVAIPPDADPPVPPLNARERTIAPPPEDDSDQPQHTPI
jgi:hypothetical protein